MTLDPLDPTRRPPPPSGGERLFLYLFSATILGLFAAALLKDFGPARFGALAILAAWLPLTALHELAHAGVAHLFGWRVLEISVGIGPRITRHQLGETRIDLRLWPLAGHVIPIPRRLRGARLASTCIYLAGPLSELAIVALIAALYGLDRLLTPQDTYLGVGLQATCAAALWGALLNLLPFTTPGGQWTDGLGALRSPFLPDAHFEQLMDGPALRAAQTQLAAGHPTAAAAALEPLAARWPDAIDVQITYATALAAAGRRGDALLHLQAARARADGLARALYDAALTRLRARP